MSLRKPRAVNGRVAGMSRVPSRRLRSGGRPRGRSRGRPERSVWPVGEDVRGDPVGYREVQPVAVTEVAVQDRLARARTHGDLVDGDPELKARVMSSIESVASDAHDLAVLARKGIAKDDKGNVKPRSVGDVVQAASKALQVKLDALKLFADVSGAKSPSKHQVETNIGELIAAAASQAERECAGQSDGPAPVSALES